MSAQAHAGTWQIGEWIADPEDDTLTRDAESVKIEPRMMRLLLCLAESHGAVVSQEQLLTLVWAGVVFAVKESTRRYSIPGKLYRDSRAQRLSSRRDSAPARRGRQASS